MNILIAVVATILGVQCGAAVSSLKMSCNNYEEVKINYTLFEDKYYLFQEEINWYAAYEDCRLKHMQLATILTEGDNNLLSDYLSSLNITAPVWVGATDEAYEGNFMWRTNGKRVDFSKWALNEPNDANLDNTDTGNCVEIVFEKTENGYRWKDNWCGYAQAYVCEGITPRELGGTLLCSNLKIN